MTYHKWRKSHQAFGGAVVSEDIGEYVLVPGSKQRVLRFAEVWDRPEEIVNHAEFLLYSGWMNGTKVSACSTGIGGTSVAVAVEELIDLGAHTFIRVGVTGTLQGHIDVGNLTIASAAIRSDRVSPSLLPISLPAVASPEVVLALQAASDELGYVHHTGLTATTGTFYCGEGRPGFDGFFQSRMNSIVDDFMAAGVMDWDTETATLLSLCLAHGVRAGRINGVVDSPSSDISDPEAEQKAVRAGLRAMENLIKRDQRMAEK